MANINGKSDVQGGYFHRTEDLTKTATARRSTFNPSLSNKITNKFARAGWPRVANMVNTVRNLDLSARQSVNRMRQSSARKNFDKYSGMPGDDAAKRSQHYGDLKERLKFDSFRLHSKRGLGDSALAGRLEKDTDIANQDLQLRLDDAGYEPLKGLKDTVQHRAESRYLVSEEDGHRIKINSERAPWLARKIADSVSGDYDRGASGFGRTARSTMQHALVGIQGAALSIKGAAAKKMAQSERLNLDQGARARMDVRAARASQKRSMLQASLQGQVALNQAYEESVNQQLDAADRRRADPEGPRYSVRAASNGIKPPQTRYWERRVSNFYRPREVPADKEAALSEAGSLHEEASMDESAPAGRKAGRFARFAVGVSNLRAKRELKSSAGNAAYVHAKSMGIHSEEKQARYDQEQRRNETAFGKWGYAVAARRSVLQGQLLETLKGEEMQQTMNETFPRHTELHGELPFPRSARDDERSVAGDSIDDKDEDEPLPDTALRRSPSPLDE